MDKIKISLDKSEWVTVTFKKVDFKILSHIPLNIKTELLNDYVNTLFKDTNDVTSNFIQAEYTQILSVIDKLTSIEVIDLENNVLNVDDVISSGLWEFVQNKIEDYDQLKWEQDAIIELKQKQLALEKSVGSVVEGLSLKLMVFLDKLNELDVSNEGINKLVTELKTGLNDLDKKWGPTKPTTPKKQKGTAKNSQIL